jgi:hypothetical protein
LANSEFKGSALHQLKSWFPGFRARDSFFIHSWHMSCALILKGMKIMAKKMNLMALFQELDGRARLMNRRPAAQASGVYLMQLRAQNGALTLPRRRFSIAVDLSKTHPLPQSVKITHVRPVDASPDPGAKHTSIRMSLQKAELPKVSSKAG